MIRFNRNIALASPRSRRRRRKFLRPFLVVLIGWLIVALTVWVGLEPRAAGLLKTTFLLAATTCLAALPPGIALAWLVWRTDLPGRQIARAAIVAMLFVPLYCTAAAWQAGFGVLGWATWTLGVGVWLEGFAGAVWIHAMAALPWVVLLAGIGLCGVEPELEEQALLDGTPAAVFRRVTLPASAWSIVLAAIWVAVVVAGEMTVTDLFDVRTFAEEIYTALSRSENPLPSAGAGFAMLGLAVVAGVAVAARLGAPRRPLSRRTSVVFTLGRWRWPAAAGTIAVLLVVVGLPLGNLVYQAGSIVRTEAEGRQRGWSVVKCGTIFVESPYRFRREIGWSTLLGATAATGCAAAAAAAAWWARRRSGRSRALAVLAGASVAVPGPLVALATIALLNRPELPGLVWLYDQSIAAPWLVATIRGFGPAALVLAQTYRAVPEELIESATLDGAGPVGRFWHLAVRGRPGALAAAWLLVFVWTVGELAATILVAPPGMTTLSTQIFNLLHAGVTDYLAGLCLLVWAACAAAAAGIVRLVDTRAAATHAG